MWNQKQNICYWIHRKKKKRKKEKSLSQYPSCGSRWWIMREAMSKATVNQRIKGNHLGSEWLINNWPGVIMQTAKEQGRKKTQEEHQQTNKKQSHVCQEGAFHWESEFCGAPKIARCHPKIWTQMKDSLDEEGKEKQHLLTQTINSQRFYLCLHMVTITNDLN